MERQPFFKHNDEVLNLTDDAISDSIKIAENQGDFSAEI